MSKNGPRERRTENNKDSAAMNSLTRMSPVKIATWVALSFIWFSGPAVNADDYAGNAELARLEGVWSFVVVKVNGKEQPRGGHEADRMIIQRDGRFAVVQRPQITHGTLSVDPSKTPKQYDVHIATGRIKGLVVPCVYEIAGDTLTLCMPLGKQRPTEVASKPGDAHLFEVFKREQRDVKPALVAAGRRELTGTWQSVTYALGGKQASADDIRRISLVFDREGKTQALRDGKVFIASTTQIDPTADPATIDITFSSGEVKGGTALGIYKIEDGVLTICRADPGQARPAVFSSDPGNGWTLMSYRKAPASK
jgi:uncharacterized protein (TIGR03067 family)